MIFKIIRLVITLYSNNLIVFIQNKQTVMFYMRAHQNLTHEAQFDCSFLQVKVGNEFFVII